MYNYQCISIYSQSIGIISGYALFKCVISSPTSTTWVSTQVVVAAGAAAAPCLAPSGPSGPSEDPRKMIMVGFSTSMLVCRCLQEGRD